MPPEALQKALIQIVEKAWADEAYKERLVATPVSVFRESGIAVPPGVEIRVVEDTPTISHFVLPPRPDSELTLEQLERVAGGGAAVTPQEGLRNMAVASCGAPAALVSFTNANLR